MEYYDARLETFQAQRAKVAWGKMKRPVKYMHKVAKCGWYLVKTPANCACFCCNATRTEFNGKDRPCDGHSSTCIMGRFWTSFENDSMDAAENEQSRTYTFQLGWPHEGKEGWDSVAPRKMAAAGFICLPVRDGEDSVMCPYCGILLDGWEKTDDPVQEHRRRSPDCRFFQSELPKREPQTEPPKAKMVTTTTNKSQTRKIVPAAGPSVLRSKRAKAPEVVVDVNSSETAVAGQKRKSALDGHKAADDRLNVKRARKGAKSSMEEEVDTAAEILHALPSDIPTNKSVSRMSSLSSSYDHSSTESADFSREPDTSMMSETTGDSSEPKRSRRTRAKPVSYAEDALVADSKQRKLRKAKEESQTRTDPKRRNRTAKQANREGSELSDSAASEGSAQDSDISLGLVEPDGDMSEDDGDYNGVLAVIDEQVRRKFGGAGSSDMSEAAPARTTRARENGSKESTALQPPTKTAADNGKTLATKKVASKSVETDVTQDENAIPKIAKRNGTARSRTTAKATATTKTSRPTRKAVGTRNRTTRAAAATKAVKIEKNADDTDFIESEVETASVSGMQSDQISMYSEEAESVLDQCADDRNQKQAAPQTKTNMESQMQTPITPESTSDDGKDHAELLSNNIPRVILGIRNRPGFVDHISVPKLSVELPAGERGLTDVEGRMRLERYLDMEGERFCDLLEEKREDAWNTLMEEHGKLVRWIEAVAEADE